MAISPHLRFEVFKRDRFTCRYCGRTSPDVVLEVDHIVPVCAEGSDDELNLTTSCWECNRGKRGTPLEEVITAEDPHDRAVLLLEQQRQLREYNAVLARERQEREATAESLLGYWCEMTGEEAILKNQFAWLVTELKRTPEETIRAAMDVAVSRGATKDWRYIMVVVRNWREDGEHRGPYGTY